MLRTHCGGHKCFPVCPRGQHLLRTQNLCLRHKNVFDFFQKHFLSATNVSPFARPRKHHEQQCVRHNVSSFATTLREKTVFKVWARRVTVGAPFLTLTKLPTNFMLQNIEEQDASHEHDKSFHENVYSHNRFNQIKTNVMV